MQEQDKNYLSLQGALPIRLPCASVGTPEISIGLHEGNEIRRTFDPSGRRCPP